MKRWTLYEFPGGRCEVYPGEPNPGDPEGIEVMPVGEHEAVSRIYHRGKAAEAAARDFAAPLRAMADRDNWDGAALNQRSGLLGHFTPYELATNALARHPEFSEGTSE